MVLYHGAVPWCCTMVLYHGTVPIVHYHGTVPWYSTNCTLPWYSTVVLYRGTVPWYCTVHCGKVPWYSTMVPQYHTLYIFAIAISGIHFTLYRNQFLLNHAQSWNLFFWGRTPNGMNICENWAGQRWSERSKTTFCKSVVSLNFMCWWELSSHHGTQIQPPQMKNPTTPAHFSNHLHLVRIFNLAIQCHEWELFQATWLFC